MMTAARPKTYDAFVQGNFLSEASELLDGLEIALGNARSSTVPFGEAARRVEHFAQFARSQAQQAGFHLIGKVAEKMAAFAQAMPEGGDHALDMLQIYAATLADLVEDYRQDRGALVDEALLERLPEPMGAPKDFTVAPGMELTALLAVPDKTTRNFLERELNNSGIQVRQAVNVGEAMQAAVCARPSFAVISAVLDAEITGVEVILALRAIPRLQGLPIGLLTSYTRESPELRGLPEDVPLISKNHFADDMAETLVKAGIF